MIETEKKYRLDNSRREEVVSRLKESGAADEGVQFEENVIYGGGILDEKNAVLRVRITESRCVLTYKRRLASESSYKEQLEYESEFSDDRSLREILYALGFKPRLIYEKNRHTWKLRNVEVVLDELPFGEYMEIEGSITDIAEAEMLLDITGLEAENETYPRLTSRLGTVVNGVCESRFARKDQSL
jgi:adenylate cyclase class 2